MDSAIYPIMMITTPSEWAFPLDLEDIFEEEGAKADDEVTYTTRYEVDPEDKETVERIKARIRDEMDSDEADRFIAFMERHGWNVNFLVGTD